MQFQDSYGNLALLEEYGEDAIAAMLCYDGTAPALVIFLDVFIVLHGAALRLCEHL